MNDANPEETAKEGIELLKKFFTSIGMPINFKELGAKEEDIPRMVEKLGLGKTHTIGSFVKLTDMDVEQIYRLAL
jgi:alcohol dehydrogenase YqhD (iron-dependent ADH family)